MPPRAARARRAATRAHRPRTPTVQERRCGSEPAATGLPDLASASSRNRVRPGRGPGRRAARRPRTAPRPRGRAPGREPTGARAGTRGNQPSLNLAQSQISHRNRQPRSKPAAATAMRLEDLRRRPSTVGGVSPRVRKKTQGPGAGTSGAELERGCRKALARETRPRQVDELPRGRSKVLGRRWATPLPVDRNAGERIGMDGDTEVTKCYTARDGQRQGRRRRELRWSCGPYGLLDHVIDILQK